MVREPKAFLMDEPLSNLDAKLRVSMRAELARLHERLGVTTVYVTHDQTEAMTLGQRVAVLRDGVLQQCDTPQQLFDNPANLFVAAFIGSPAMNLVTAEVTADSLEFAGISLPLADNAPVRGRPGNVILGIRPTDFVLPGDGVDLPRVTITPEVVESLGAESNLIFPVGGAAGRLRFGALGRGGRRGQALRRRDPGRVHGARGQPPADPRQPAARARRPPRRPALLRHRDRRRVDRRAGRYGLSSTLT